MGKKGEPDRLKIDGSWEDAARKLLATPAKSTPEREKYPRKKASKKKASKKK